MASKKKEPVEEIAKETKEVIKETKEVKTYTRCDFMCLTKEERIQAIADIKSGKAKLNLED